MSQTTIPTTTTAVSSNPSNLSSVHVGEAIFSSKTSWILASTSVFLVLFAVIMALYGAKPYDTSATLSHSYSRHVLGHRLLVDFLQQSNINVLRVHSPRSLVSVSSPLFFIEPLDNLSVHNDPATLSGVLERRLRAGRHTVVVLPKWRQHQRSMQPGYQRNSALQMQKSLTKLIPPLVPALSIQQQPVDFDPKTQQSRWSDIKANWKSQAPTVSSTAPSEIRLQILGPQTFQVTDSGWNIILGNRKRAWVVSYTSHQEGQLIVVSDPDLIHNFNIQRGDNAAVTWGIVRHVLNTDTILIDEVFHNQIKQFSLPEELGRFPRSLLVFHALLLWGFLVWAGATRFGKPVTLHQHRQHGPKEIIDITAWVLVCGLQPSRLAAQYVHQVLDDLAERLGLGTMEMNRKVEQIDILAERWSIRPEAVDLYQKASHLQQHRRSWLDAMRLARRAWSFRHQMLSRRCQGP